MQILRCRRNVPAAVIPTLTRVSDAFGKGVAGSSLALHLLMAGTADDSRSDYSVYTKYGAFEWSRAKAAVNVAKHGVSFDDAMTAFGDPRALDGPDVRHSSDEPRRLRLGLTATQRIVTVAYTKRGYDHGENIRLISARQANRREREAYRRTD
jgi:uncharacterized DUF497 family protein